MQQKNRVQQLRKAMQEQGVQAFIIPSSDPHQSEYVADRWKAREWISNFTGSAGTAIVGLEKAALWTDGRYFLQAATELEGTGIELMKGGLPETPTDAEWLIDTLEKGSVVACDGNNFSIHQIEQLKKKLEKGDLSLRTDLDLIEDIWEDRPSVPQLEIFPHEVQYAGKSREDKINEVRTLMNGADGHLITTLDDIAWVLNIRGYDVECNPVAIAFCLIQQENVYLFTDEPKVPKPLQKQLNKAGVVLESYNKINTFLQKLPENYTLIIDPYTVNANLFACIPKHCKIKRQRTISTDLKAIKNPTEIQHIEEVMAKDAVALVKLYRWLEEKLNNGKSVSEFEVSEQLIDFRKQGADYYGESFPAIVGYKGNGAIIHYRPLAEQCAMIQNEGILLLDSGGQYKNGTTDITRTTALGNPTPEQKIHFTLVLKGHIALARQRFPEGTTGTQLDTLSRQFLWQQHLDFGHGTGHGVGFFLNVHEGPQGIGKGVTGRYAEPIKAGMFSSNEPGFYLSDEYGIRIENLIISTKDKETDFGSFLKFDTVTLFPMDLKLVENTMLNYDEKQWLNDYHKKVLEKVLPLLSDEKDRAWLQNQCRLI